MSRTQTSALCIFLLIFATARSSQAKQVSYNRRHISPNGKFSVQLVSSMSPTQGERHPSQPVDCLFIQDKESKSSQTIEILTPIYTLNWTGDSNTIVIVQHLAGGSGVYLIRRQEGKWLGLSVDAPGVLSEGDYAVVSQKIYYDNIRVVYKAIDESKTRPEYKYYLVGFKFSTSSGVITSHVSRKEIDAATYSITPFIGE